MKKKLIVILVAAVLVVLYMVRTKKSGYSCASTDDHMSVQAQGAQCHQCEGSWDNGDCLKQWPGGGFTRGSVRVYDASGNMMPGKLWRWKEGAPRPDPAYPSLWK